MLLRKLRSGPSPDTARRLRELLATYSAAPAPTMSTVTMPKTEDKMALDVLKLYQPALVQRISPHAAVYSTVDAVRNLVHAADAVLGIPVVNFYAIYVMIGFAAAMDTYVSLLQTYSGRDKILRTTGYLATLLSGSVGSELTEKKLVTIARQISNSRVVLRFFDDIPMWRITSRCSPEETDRYARIFSILSNISIQTFFPCEHINWLSDQNILSGNLSGFGTAATVCWGLSLVFNILKSVRKITLLKRKREQIRRQRQLESPDKSGEAETVYRTALRECNQQEVMEGWNLLKNISDLMIAVNALPWRPFLWAGKFRPSRSAAFGTISSLVGLYLLIIAQRKAKSNK